MKLLVGGGELGHFGGLLLFLSSHLVVSVSGRVLFLGDTQCAQLGQWNDARTIGGNMFPVEQPINMASIGSILDHHKLTSYDTLFRGYKDDPSYWNLGCPNGWINAVENANVRILNHDFCPAGVKIRTYLVRQNGKVLRGWLHFEVEIDNDEINFIYVKARDEVFNAIGEFVVDDAEQCEPSQPYLVHPTKYQFLPCSATGLREAKNSGVIFMAKRTQYTKPYDQLKNYIPKKDLSRGVHFNWKLNEYWCNRHQKIRLDTILWTTQIVNPQVCGTKYVNCVFKNKRTEYWIWPKWFGAADIKTEGPLDCSIPAIDYKTGRLSPEADAWISKSTLMTRGEDYLSKYNVFTEGGTLFLKGCQVNAYLNARAPTFGGRCQGHYNKITSHSQLHGCNLNAAAPEFQEVDTSKFIPYSDYVNFINTKRLGYCNQPCQAPNITNPDHLKEIHRFPAELPQNKGPKIKRKISFKTLTESRKTVRAATFFQTRKYHGNICIFLTMFLIPVSNFLIRYYKETFMNHLSLGCAPWFWFHLFVCIAVPIMFRSSYSAMQQNIHNFGESETSDAYLHRVGGYVFIWVFLLMVLLGAVRPVVHRLRIIAMALHSVTGFGLYFLAIFLVINSTWIPASPTVHACDPKTGVPIGFSFTAKMTVAWFMIDSLFHILLTVFQFVVDKKHLIKRPGCGLPFVPMLPAEAWIDLQGAWIRKIVLVVYVSVALVMTFVTITVNFRNDDHGYCKLGKMSCDLDYVAPNGTSSPFGCLPISLNYYNKVFDKYDINLTEISE